MLRSSTSPSHGDRWTAEYDLFNLAVAVEFFDTRNAGQPVYLDLEDDALRRIAAAAAAPPEASPAEALRTAVVETLSPPEGPSGIFRDHLAAIGVWRQSDMRDPPPCLGLLALLVLVAEGMHTDEQYAASNYYGRLADAIALTDRSAPAIQRLRNQFAKYSGELWDALRDWLLRHDGALGLPSAEAFDHRSHVGLPMSQALVRAADREAFADLFKDCRLRPGQLIGTEDMRLLIDGWLAGAQVSTSLRRLWRRADAAFRIASVACLELQSWDGTAETTEEGTARARHASLVLVASLGSVPRAFRLSLRPPSSSRLPLGTYRLSEDSTPAAREALGGGDGRLTLEEGVGGKLRLREAPRISYPDLLICTLRLRHTGTRAELVRHGGRLVVFQQDGETREYIESTSVDLGADLWLLCHDGLRDRIRAMLTSAARPGWLALGAGDLPGVPEGWTLFRGVQLFQSVDLDASSDRDLELQVLQPVSTTHVHLGGGLGLPGRSRWHSARPPEIRLASPSDHPMTAELLSLSTGRTPQRELRRWVFTRAAVHSLGDDTSDGDYRIIVRDRSGAVAITASFALRSADYSVARLESPAWIGRALLDGNAGAFARAAVEGPVPPDVPTLQGLVVIGLIPHTSQQAQAPLWDLVSVSEVDDRGLLYESTAGPSVGPRSAAGRSCIATGVHCFVIPSVSPFAAVRMREHTGTCKYCGLSYLWRRRRRRDSSSHGAASHRADGAGRMRQPLLRIEGAPSSEGDISADLLLDALSLERQGSFRSFAALAKQVCDETWYPAESLYDLSSLGHLEFTRDADTSELSSWAIAAPTISLHTDTGEAILAGARSKSLLNALEMWARANLLVVGRETSGVGPLRVAVSNVSVAQARMLVEELPPVQGLEVKLALDADRLLVEACPPLSQVLGGCPTMSPNHPHDTRTFDPRSASWVASTRLIPWHAYLLPGPTRIVCVYALDSAGEPRLFLTDYRVAKYIAAAAQNVALLEYDAAAETLWTPLGCRLPDLYERVAMARAGRPPDRTGRRLAYAHVRALVAHSLMAQVTR